MRGHDGQEIRDKLSGSPASPSSSASVVSTFSSRLLRFPPSTEHFDNLRQTSSPTRHPPHPHNPIDT
eukprot:759179-Hanusia_phi.AAC.1